MEVKFFLFPVVLLCRLYVSTQMFPFGDTALIITNVDEFINRISKTVKSKGYKIDGRPVEYFDESIYHGHVGLFKKRNSLEYMKEYRIVISAKMDNMPYELFIGDISDISMIIKAEDINKVMVTF